jgi:hypothetical protein
MASRTWVSGVGDDANPGSRTAPCKTFVGAISKTDTSGEVSVLDPGGYGTVTVTRSVTIDGGSGKGWASIMATNTNGIVVNAPNGVVTLRNLSINGNVTGQVGIRIVSAKAVFVEECTIFNFGATTGADVGHGISDVRTDGGRLFVINTVIRNNANRGILVSPSTGATPINVTIDNVHLIGNGNGLEISAGVIATISRSVITGNTAYGLVVTQPDGSTELNVDSCVIAQNANGVATGDGTPIVRLADSMIVDNGVGISVTGGAVASFTNNSIAGNGTGNAPTPGSRIPLE